MKPYVFIHGAGCTGEVFDAQVRAFAESFAVTLPGHGRAGAPASIAEFADDVARELQERAIESAILCGSSMGGAIALELALRAHARVAAVVLLGSGARLRVAPAVFEGFERDFEGGARALAPFYFAHPTPERVEAAVALMLQVGAAQTMRDFRACDAFDAGERLPAVRLPVLALCGDADRMTPPKYSLSLADRIPGASARILPGAGHLAMIEDPAATNAALRAFVEQLETR